MTKEERKTGDGVEPWRRVSTEHVADCRVFEVTRQRNENPRDRLAHDFYVLRAADWVNIIPITANGEVVMVEQYRHGIDQVTLEIPGGIVDEGEDAQTAGVRELYEETGYRAAEVIGLGTTHPNPAILNNRLHTYFAPNVVADGAPPMLHDATEETLVRLVPIADVPGLIATGVITHALVVVGFHLLSLKRSDVMPRA